MRKTPRKWLKLSILIYLVTFCSLFLAACSNHYGQNQTNTKVVTDMQSQKVKIPKKVSHVASLWHANNQIVLLLGRSNDLVATTPMIKKNFWFKKVDPKIAKVTSPYAGDQIQVEELLKTKPDVVIVANPAQAKIAKEAHLPLVNAMFSDFSGLKKSVKLTANVLGGDAPKVAQNYNRELDHNLNWVKQKLAKTKTRPSVLHFVNAIDLTKVDGQKTIVDEWIKSAGGVNAIKKSGNQISITAEELVKSDPDVIIVGQSSTQQALKALKRNPVLRNLKAVKNGKVYGNPQGTFPWDRYSAEEALQVLWAAQKLHPQVMKALKMDAKVKSFYEKYYHYQLSKREVKEILNNNK